MSYVLKFVLKVAFYSGAFFYTLYALFALLPPNFQEWAKNVLLALSLICAFIRFFAGYVFNMDFNQVLLQTLYNTNLAETLAFLKSQTSSILLILALIFGCALFLWVCRFEWVISRRLNLFLLGFIGFGIGAHVGRTAYLSAQIGSLNLAPPEVLDTLPLIKETRAVYFSLQAGSSVVQNALNQPYPKDYLKVDVDSVPNVVLIVGESASKNFMGIYGYPVPNTPFLSGLEEREREREREKTNSLNLPNLFVFDNVISAFSNTEANFQVLLNYSDTENAKIPWYRQKDLGGVFKLAGYQTFWLDNQYPARSSSATELLPRRFGVVLWTSSFNTDDMSLLDLFNTKVHPKLDAKNLIVFHLMGSHLLYKDRFPLSFAKFTPKDIPYQGLHVQNDKDKQIIADYVNSLYYTDHVLGEIFKLFQDKDAIIVYLSDHAQDIFESSNTYGHKCSNFGVEIPFVIYVTDTFKQKHPDKVKAIAEAINKPFMSDDLIHSLLPIVGIHTKDNLESKNLFSPQFDIKRKRIYCGDQIYKHN